MWKRKIILKHTLGICYPLVNYHSNGNPTFLIGDISTHGWFSIVILVYRSVNMLLKLQDFNISTIWITSPNIYPDVTHFNLYAQHEESQTSVEDRTLMTRPPSNILQNNKSSIYLSLTLKNQRQKRQTRLPSQPKTQQQVRSSKQLRSKSITARALGGPNSGLHIAARRIHELNLGGLTSWLVNLPPTTPGHVPYPSENTGLIAGLKKKRGKPMVNKARKAGDPVDQP